MGSTRDNQVGAGYDYQWDVATFLLLTYVLPPRRRGLPLDEDFDWLGPLAGLHLEGDPTCDALEDLTFHGLNGRHLHLQLKTRESDGSRWKKADGDVIEFLNRAAFLSEDPSRRFIFLTHAAFDASLRKLLESPEDLRGYREAVAWKHFAGKNAKTVEDRVAPADGYARLGQTVFLRGFLPPTELGPDRQPMSGVAEAVMQRLYQQGIDDSKGAYERLYIWVKDQSIQKKGTPLSMEEARSGVLGLLGLSEADVVRRRSVISLFSLLGEPQRAGQLRVSLDKLRQGQLFTDPKELERAQALLEREGVLLVLGPRASGKTVFVSQLGYHAAQAGVFPMVWDFENLGRELPTDVTSYLSEVTSAAKFRDQLPLLILENAHLNPPVSQTMLSLVPRFPGLRLIVTARDREFLNQGLPTLLRERLQAALFELGDEPRLRGDRVLHWFLQEVRRLDDAELRRVLRSVDWQAFMDDLVVLRTALEAYDWEGHSLSALAFQDYLEERIGPVLREKSGSDDLLYVVAALGRSGIPVDLGAAARMLGRTEDELRAIALRLASEGLLELSADGQLVHFWHQSMAGLFWQMFQMDRERLARGVRLRLASTEG
jgi:hypothetical protein